MGSKNIKKVVRKIIRGYGFDLIRITEKAPTGDMSPDFKEIFDTCKQFTMTSVERMYALYNAVIYIVEADIEGDFAECGVWRGGSAMIIAVMLKKMGVTDRRIYLYDTYQGMSEPTMEDKPVSAKASAEMVYAKWKTLQAQGFNKWCYASLEDVKNNMVSTGYPEENVLYIKGKVEDTVPSNVPSKISLLRIDTDWYASTAHCMHHLFPLLSKHGVLILDDYGHWAGARKAVDDYLKNNNISILLNRLDTPGYSGIKL